MRVKLVEQHGDSDPQRLRRIPQSGFGAERTVDIAAPE